MCVGAQDAMSAMAALVARRRQQMLAGSSFTKSVGRLQKRPDVVDAATVSSRCLVSRQVASALGVQWKEKTLILTDARLCFCKTGQDGSDLVVDFIPMHEIARATPIAGNLDSTENRMSKRRSPTPNSHYIISVERDPFQLEEDEKDPNRVLLIETVPDGHNSGRPSVIHFESKQERDVILAEIRKLNVQALETQYKIENPGRFRLLQRRAFLLYHSGPVQGVAIFGIVGSFLVSLVASHLASHSNYSECSPFGTDQNCLSYRVLWWLENGFIVLFGSEVSLAMIALGVHAFFSDMAMVFDAGVVALCITSVALTEIPNFGAVRMFRVLRLVRVFTLMKRLDSLRILVKALGNSIVPVIYSFLLLFLILAVFSLIATELFAGLDPNNFGDIQKSAFSLFQVTKGPLQCSVRISNRRGTTCTPQPVHDAHTCTRMRSPAGVDGRFMGKRDHTWSNRQQSRGPCNFDQFFLRRVFSHRWNGADECR